MIPHRQNRKNNDKKTKSLKKTNNKQNYNKRQLTYIKHHGENNEEFNATISKNKRQLTYKNKAIGNPQFSYVKQREQHKGHGPYNKT